MDVRINGSDIVTRVPSRVLIVDGNKELPPPQLTSEVTIGMNVDGVSIEKEYEKTTEGKEDA